VSALQSSLLALERLRDEHAALSLDEIGRLIGGWRRGDCAAQAR
jgi:hypothetical protein